MIEHTTVIRTDYRSCKEKQLRGICYTKINEPCVIDAINMEKQNYYIIHRKIMLKKFWSKVKFKKSL